MQTLTFVTHDCDVHASFFQHSQSLSFTAVLQVAEIKPGYKDPEAEVGGLVEELSQSEGAVCTGRPGAKPGDGVADFSLTSDSITPQARAQGSQVAQEKQLQT